MAKKKGTRTSPTRAEIDAAEIEASIQVQQTTYSEVTDRARRVLARVCGLTDYGKATDEQIDTVFVPFKKRLMARHKINPELVD